MNANFRHQVKLFYNYNTTTNYNYNTTTNYNYNIYPYAAIYYIELFGCTATTITGLYRRDAGFFGVSGRDY